MTKFENLMLDVEYEIKVNKIHNARLNGYFTEGNTYKMKTSIYERNYDLGETTTRFICHACDKAGFCQIDEFEADLEIVKTYGYFFIWHEGKEIRFETYEQALDFAKQHNRWVYDIEHRN